MFKEEPKSIAKNQKYMNIKGCTGTDPSYSCEHSMNNRRKSLNKLLGKGEGLEIVINY
jgi:hypothetical protein